MGFVDWLKDIILGIKIIGVEDAKQRFNDAVHICDINNDGWLDARELIKVFRELVEK